MAGDFFPVGIAHSIVGDMAWELTPWRAVQRAAWDVLSKDEVRLLLPVIARRRAAARPSPAPSAGQRP